jgi:flagellar secretion chaperone FliS
MPNRVSVYLEQEILAANNVQLIHILYQSAIHELRDARKNMACRKVPQKCANFSRACSLIGELYSALDLDAGGEIAVNLKALYEYMLAQLLQANIRNLDEPVAQVLALLSTLDEGWKELANQRTSSESELSATNAATRQGGRETEAPLQVWSF